jgi:hypothetical protein
MNQITTLLRLSRALMVVGFLCLTQLELFAFVYGDRVQANGLVYVRSSAGGTYIGQQSGGTQGTVIGGPTYSQIAGAGVFYYWYNIDWPSAPDGWVADVGLILAPASAPIVQSLAATSVTTTSAQINGSVNPNGASTSAYFEFGLTSNYGSASGALNGITTAQNIQANWPGLTPNTTYHYRIVASNSGGTSRGADISFTTGQAQTKPTVITLPATYCWHHFRHLKWADY